MSDSRPEKCSQCTNPCTIHLTQIVDGNCAKVDICQDCPMAKNTLLQGSYNLVADLEIEKLPESPLLLGAGSCPACGFTKENFKERGRLGCSYCYTHFEKSIEPILDNIHRGTEHVGKYPKNHVVIEPQLSVEDLKKRLNELVLREEFEEAAVVRDQIKELEA